jgi:hypothetical protein
VKNKLDGLDHVIAAAGAESPEFTKQVNVKLSADSSKQSWRAVRAFSPSAFRNWSKCRRHSARNLRTRCFYMMISMIVFVHFDVQRGTKIISQPDASPINLFLIPREKIEGLPLATDCTAPAGG